MRVTVSVWRSRGSDEDHDVFLPFAATCDARFIAMRGATEEEAADNVVGAVLCALGQRRRPPRDVHFEVKRGKPKR